MSLLLWSLYHSNLEITFNFSPVLASGFDSNLKWKPIKSPSKLKSFNIWHLLECFKRLKYLILTGSQSMCNSNHCKIWEICQEPFKSSLRGFQCAKWEKKVTPTEKVIQYAHCLNWRPSEWKTGMMGKKETKIKADYTMKLKSLTYIAYPYPFQKAIVFILWLSLGSPFTLSFYVYVGSFFNLLLCAISIYTIQFWNVDNWWNSDFLQSSDSIALFSMNTPTLSMWLNIFIRDGGRYG